MSRTVDLNKKVDRRLTSVNLTLEMFDYLDRLAKDSGLSRSSLIEAIVKDFKDNKRSITITIVGE